MPIIAFQNVPKDPDKIYSFLVSAFRTVEDTFSRTVESVGSKDIEITDSSAGVILTSPDGTRYLITVDNAGTLSTTAL